MWENDFVFLALTWCDFTVWKKKKKSLLKLCLYKEPD